MIYDLLILLFAVGSLPKVIWERWKKKKKRPTFRERLGLSIPNPKGKPVIWIHAVSVGETRAAQPLFIRFRKEYPDSFILITHATATGQEEAKRSLPSADAYAFLPLDLSFIMKRWAKALRPTHFILIESDFWYNQLRFLKKQNTHLTLASGKMSPRSAARFLKCSFFAKKLFGLFDLLCVQNQEHCARFAPFVEKVYIEGNLKLDFTPQTLDLSPYKHLSHSRAITIASTHAPEEEELLTALKPLLPDLLIYLTPRHPDRFNAVEEILKDLHIPAIRLSQIANWTGQEKVVLIDSMGKLPIFYTLSRLAIVGGSFTDKVGGHNVLEPCFYGCPSFFGPHTYSQKEFTSLILESKAGAKIPLQELKNTLENLLKNPTLLNDMRASAALLSDANRGVGRRIFQLIGKKEFGDKV